MSRNQYTELKLGNVSYESIINESRKSLKFVDFNDIRFSITLLDFHVRISRRNL